MGVGVGAVLGWQIGQSQADEYMQWVSCGGREGAGYGPAGWGVGARYTAADFISLPTGWPFTMVLAWANLA